MLTGAFVLTAWLALLCGFVAGLAWHAYRLEGVALVTRKFFAEVAVLAAGLSLILYGPALLWPGLQP